jgi:hypothetical protein
MRDRQTGDECRNDSSRSQNPNRQRLGFDGEAEKSAGLARHEKGAIGQGLVAACTV